MIYQLRSLNSISKNKRGLSIFSKLTLTFYKDDFGYVDADFKLKALGC